MTGHERLPDQYVRPAYPVDEPPTFRARCSCGWVSPQTRYRYQADLPGTDHRRHAAATS